MKSLVKINDLSFKPPPLGLVLFYPGLPGGGSKLYDKSPYGNNGSIVGATWVKSPLGLWCLSFDGTDDYVNCGNPDSIRYGIGDSFTMEAWVYLNSLGSSSRQIMSKRKQWAVDNVEFFYSQYDDFAHLYIQDGVATDGATTSVPITAGVWQHIVGTVNKTEMYCYLNGTPGLKRTRLTTTKINDVNLNIGKNAGGERWLGMIALPRVYGGYTMPPSLVKSHFEREKYLFGVW